MYPGGIADKTGNRFEARWLTRQMLGLLDGAAISITVEKIGEGDEGFEFLVERPDTAEWHQCKRQTSETSWSITALAREAIIENFSAKLQLSPSHRCVFVSTDIAKQVKLLQEKRPYALTLAEFEKILSKEETAYWLQLHDKLSFGGDAALDWIDRCEFHTLSEDFLESVVASEVAFWFKGDPEKLIAAVRTWVEEDATLNRPITRAGIVQAWLQGSDEAQVWALRFIRSISDRGADLLPAILQDYLDANPLQAGLVLDELHWLSPKQPAPALADVIIRALGMIEDLKHLEARSEGQFEAYGSWIPHAPDDAARILAASLACWYRLTAEGVPFKPAFENGTGTFHHLVELAKARPIAMLNALLSCCAIRSILNARSSSSESRPTPRR